MRTLLRYLGYLFFISGLFRLIPIAVGFAHGERPFLLIISMLISLAVGLFFYLYNRPLPMEIGLNLSQGLTLVALSFILLPALGAISYLPTLGYHFLDAYFESVSGFTTTGLTMYTALDDLPRALVLWRAMTQWMGGIGIIMIFLFILSRLHHNDYTHVDDLDPYHKSVLALTQAQGMIQFEGSFKKNFTSIIFVYFGYTALGIFLLYFAGLPLFDAVAMSFTSLSTGGFGLHDQFYTDSTVLTILSLLMILGSISFISHIQLLWGRWMRFLKSFEKNVFLVFLLLAVLITLTVSTDLKVILFTLISAFTTTGYALSNIALYPSLFIMMIVVGMVIGGSFASTSGGVKVFRFYYLLRTIPWSLKKLVSPKSAVIPLKIHGEEVDEPKLANIGVFMFVYFLILFVGTILFMIFGHNFLDSIFQMTSALGTVGLQTTNIIALNPVLKVILIVAMLFGRLEIFPILIVVRNLFQKKKNRQLHINS